MAKSKRRPPQPIPTRQPPKPESATVEVSLGYNPQGEMEPRDVVASKDGWSEYTLDDGTTIRLKAALLDVKRALDQYSQDGNPLYIFQWAIVNQVKAPDKLKKQG